MKALRGRPPRDRLGAQLLQAADASEARHVIHQHLGPAVRRDGRVIYHLDDGGLVSDEAKAVRVSQVTTGAAFLALTLAADRFGQRPLPAPLALVPEASTTEATTVCGRMSRA